MSDKPTSKAGVFKETYKATWTEPDGAADKFLIYGVTACLRYSKANDNKPCVVKGMAIPAKSLKLLGTAPGTARSASVAFTMVGEEGPGPYASFLIRATNAAGNSKFTILDTDRVCYQCTY